MARNLTSAPVVGGQWLPTSFEEFVAWVPEGGQAEWVGGKGISPLSTSPRHSRLLEFLADLLHGYLRLLDLGELFTSNILRRATPAGPGRMPNIIVVREERRNRVGRLWVEGPSDLIVELVSDESIDRDREAKFREYEAVGVPECVIVDARERVQGFDVFRLGHGGQSSPSRPTTTGATTRRSCRASGSTRAGFGRNRRPTRIRSSSTSRPRRIGGISERCSASRSRRPAGEKARRVYVP